MELTKEWLNSKKQELREGITQLERDLYAKDGALQALELVEQQLALPSPEPSEQPKG